MKAALKTLDITSIELKMIQHLLKQYLPDTTVWAYGSRVNGNAQPASDLDLVAFTEQPLAISELREAFEESNLPYRIDLFTWEQIPEIFKETIMKKYAVIQSGNE